MEYFFEKELAAAGKQKGSDKISHGYVRTPGGGGASDRSSGGVGTKRGSVDNTLIPFSPGGSVSFSDYP